LGLTPWPETAYVASPGFAAAPTRRDFRTQTG
jgi:hypothetical protein